jgi:hypothetical protein
MNRTNYNKHLEQVTLNLTCVKCDIPFTRKVPKLPGKNPTMGVCYKCQQQNKTIAFGLEGGNRQIRGRATETNQGGRY